MKSWGQDSYPLRCILQLRVKFYCLGNRRVIIKTYLTTSLLLTLTLDSASAVMTLTKIMRKWSSLTLWHSTFSIFLNILEMQKIYSKWVSFHLLPPSFCLICTCTVHLMIISLGFSFGFHLLFIRKLKKNSSYSKCFRTKDWAFTYGT